MKQLKVMALGTAVLATFLLFVQTGAQVKKGKERPLTTKHLMAGLILPNCSDLGKALNGEEPKDDKGWDKLSQQAELLNESAYILMADGRCPDEKWAKATKTLRECSVVVQKAIGDKKLAEAKAAFGEMTKSCADCHKAHKK